MIATLAAAFMLAAEPGASPPACDSDAAKACSQTDHAHPPEPVPDNARTRPSKDQADGDSARSRDGEDDALLKDLDVIENLELLEHLELFDKSGE